MRLFLTASAAVLALAAASSASAEEGMWTYDNFPIARANTALGTDIDQAWLDHARLSSVRLTTGCSAGIVSGEGLVMTNNHCVASCVQNISTPEVQYAETGFTSGSREEERRCPGMQAEVLVLGNRGRGGFSKALLGSVTAYITHHATCPVLVVRPED